MKDLSTKEIYANLIETGKGRIENPKFEVLYDAECEEEFVFTHANMFSPQALDAGMSPVKQNACILSSHIEVTNVNDMLALVYGMFFHYLTPEEYMTLSASYSSGEITEQEFLSTLTQIGIKKRELQEFNNCCAFPLPK